MNNPSNQSSKRGYTLILIAGVFWGCIGPGLQFLSNLGLDPMQASFFLQLFAFIGIIPIVLIQCGVKALKIDIRILPILIVVGILSEALFDIFYTYAVNSIGVAVSGVLLYTSPLFVMIASRILFKENITKNKLIAFAINLVGCFLTISGGSLTDMSLNTRGILFGILAAICYGAMTVADKYTAGSAEPAVITFYMLLSGCITLSLIAKVWTFPAEIMVPKNFIAGAVVGVLSTMIPYLFFAKGLACDIEASKAPVYASVEIIVSAILGVVMFHETVGFMNIVGIAVVILSIAVMNKE